MSRSQMIGTISEFNSTFDDWDVYYERLEQYFEVNEVPDVKRSAFLISVIGANAYKSLRDLCHPVAPKDKPFLDLCELLRKQFSPQVSIFRERAKFYNARQETYENVTQWYGKLKRLSVDCKFGDSLQSILLDKFITGLRPGQVLDRLCEENETLKLEQGLDIAVNKECAARENAYAPVPRGFRPQICPPRPQPCLFGGKPVGVASNSLFQTSQPAAAVCFGGPSAPVRMLSAAPLEASTAGACFGESNNALFGADNSAGFGAAGFAAPKALAFSAPAERICAKVSAETDVVAAPPAPVGALWADQPVEAEVEADGVPEGTDRVVCVQKKGRVRTRRRGQARRNAAGDSADKTSVDGEKEG
ncbi:uncharacterized protein LOC131689662 [Topomyia yanbarensis]|uniref:uncharacterized protein LOC131689662 n=1 Tax=Topomyia yanbarensis TaxID=2498891 RepID=UPI00273C4B19|nr:uncharacterized protein LOC131689662 [Topomyia yanbarensis]